MPSIFYGLDRGQTEFDITSSAVTMTKDVEVLVDLPTNMDKADVLRAVDMIKNHILKNNWPPA